MREICCNSSTSSDVMKRARGKRLRRLVDPDGERVCASPDVELLMPARERLREIYTPAAPSVEDPTASELSSSLDGPGTLLSTVDEGLSLSTPRLVPPPR